MLDSPTGPWVRPSGRMIAVSCGFSFAVVAAIVTALAFTEGTASATAYTSSASGAWNVPTTWSPTGVPGTAPGDTVLIQNIITFPVGFNISPVNAIAGMSFSGGSLTIQGGTLSMKGATTYNLTAPITMSGGTWNLDDGTPSTFNLTSGFTWSGGTIGGVPATTFNLNSGVFTFDSTASSIGINNATLVIGTLQTLNYNASPAFAWANSAAAITNNGTLAVTGAGTLSNFAGQPFTNNGSFDVSPNGGMFTVVSGSLVNNGAVTVRTAGTLQLRVGGSSSGSWTTNLVGSAIDVAQGTMVLNPGAAVGGLGIIKVTAPSSPFGNLRLAAGTVVTIPSLDIAGGTVDDLGASTLNVTTLTWSAGFMTGTAAATSITNLTGNATISPIGPITLGARTLNSAGTINYTPAVIPNIWTVSGIVDNSGSFNTLADGSLGGSGTVTNRGTMNKSATPGVLIFSPNLNNVVGGVVNINGGTLQFDNTNRGTSDGNFNVAAGATLDVMSGLPGYTLSPTASITTAATSIVAVDNFGNANMNANLTLPNVTVNNGTWSGSGNLIVTSALNLSNFATMSGTGLTTIPILATATVGPGFVSIARSVTNQGTVNWTSDNQLGLGGTFDNQGTFNASNPTANTFISGSATFLNSGSFNRTGAAGTATQLSLSVFNNTNTINVSNGVLQFASGVGYTSSGAININNAASTVDVTSGVTMTITGGAIAGPGTFRVRSGTLHVNAGIPISNLALQNGGTGPAQLDGDASITIGNLTWTEGIMGATSSAAGITTVGGTTTMAGAVFNALKTRTFNNNGSFVFSPTSGNFTLDGAVFNNNGTFDDTTDGTINQLAASAFNNAGTFQKSGGAGFLEMFPVFDNRAPGGVLRVSSGAIRLHAPGNTSSAAIDLPSATAYLSVLTGSLALTGGLITPASVGALRVEGGTLTEATSTYTVPLLVVNSGTVTGSSPNILSVTTLQFNGGTITGTFTVSVSGGTIIPSIAASLSGPGLIFNNGGLLALSAAASTFSIDNGVTFNNSGVFDINGDGGIGSAGGTNTFANTGTFEKIAGAGTSNIGAALTFNNNGGTVLVNTGTMAFAGPFTDTSAALLGVPGGSVSFALPVTINGTLNGTGTVVAPGGLTNSGNVNPGTSPGALAITGNYTQTSTGNLNIQLGGTTPGTQYDQLNVSGSVTLAGNLNVSTIFGFVPAPGDSFTILTFGSRPGSTDFTAKNGLGTLAATYTATALIIGSGAADVSLTKGGPASVLNGQSITYTLTASNAGPDPATNVTIVDSLPLPATSAPGCSGVGTTTVTCSTASLAAGGSVSFTITMTTTSPGSVTNTATVSATEGDPNSTNNSASVVTAVAPNGDLAITKSAPASAAAGSAISYSLNVNNAGPDPSGPITVTDTLPAGVGFVSATGSGWSCSFSAGTVTCSGFAATPLNPGAAPPITIVVTAPVAAGPITNTANVSSSTADSNSTNNSASATTAITAAADLSITKSGPASVVAGQTVTYSFTVANLGPSNVSTAGIADAPGAGLTFVSNAGGCASGFPCTIANLNAGQTITFTSTWTVAANATGTISNTATISAAGVADPNSANDSSTATASVIVDSDVAVTKIGPASVSPGQSLTYSISVKNFGPSDATGVTVQDPTPAGTTFASMGTTLCSSFPCAIGNLPAGATVSFTANYTVNTGASGSITNTATVVSSSADGNSANNSSTVITSVVPKADLLIVKRGPSAIPVSGTISFTIIVTNNGPSDAIGVMVQDPTPPGTTFVSNSGACNTPFPCNLGTLTAGTTATITSTYSVSSGTNSIVNSASVSSSSVDPNPGNDSSTVRVGTSCPTAAPSIVSPTPGSTNAPLSGTINWTSVGPSYDVYFGPAGGGCSKLVATVNGTSFNYTDLSPNTDYEVRVVAVRAGCPAVSSACVQFRTGQGPCNLAAPSLQSPQSGTSISSPVRLAWAGVAGAESYHVVASVNGQAVLDSTTKETFLDVNLGDGNVSWSVTAIAGNCSSAVSTGSFNVCSPPSAPLAGVVGAPTSGNTYSVVVVNPQLGATFEFQEADNDSFRNAVTQTTGSPSVAYTHTATTQAVVLFYRVRARTSCTPTPSAYSKVIRVVILPASSGNRPSINVPAGTKDLVVQQVFIPGESERVRFTATADRPWIVKIDPSNGILTPEGITLNVTIDPAQLPNGTFTATVIVTTSPLTSGRIVTHGSGKSAPVTINLVTPVVPVDPTAPLQDSLIIPAVGRLVGINSEWRSDIRVFNGSGQKMKYLLNFVANGSTDVKQTTIETDAGATTALDDVIHNWYGFGEVGDNATGVLEVRPVRPDPGSTSPLASIVASRTYNVAANGGTLGEFIPGIPFRSFAGAGTRLSMQQIAQTASFRTNFALVEASGQPATVLMSMFNSAGTKLFDLPVALAGGEQKLLNGLLPQQGIDSLTDGRMEVQVSGGTGKVTAYASVVDNASLNPLFVSGKALGSDSAQLYVVPGAADLSNGVANWRTDMRVFNGSSSPETVNLTFFASGPAPKPVAATLTVNPNEVKVLDSVLASLFASPSSGGAIHLTTAASSQLVVTARTYNQTAGGSLGQFIPGVTLAEAIDHAGGRALNVLQVEDSVRFRTNVGLAEMTGKPATVEISVILPDSKVTPTIQVPLSGNEFRQFGLSEFGLGNVYNARVNVRIVDGDGQVTAYGSVVDQATNAPTYVAAQ